VCRDSKGHIIKAISRINLPCDATYGEALAASLVVSLNLKNFSLKGDSSVIIAALLTPAFSQDWHEESVTTSTLSLIPASFLWEARKVHRSANFCTYHMAFCAATRVFSGCILTYFLLFLLFPFVMEKIHLPLLFSHVVRLLVP
jgi:hypothetical protein